MTLRLSATTSGQLILNNDTIKRITESIPADAKFWLKPGDILVQRANTLDYVGTAAIFDGPQKTYIYPDLMMRIRPRERFVDTGYLWRFINSHEAKTYLRAKATGTAGNMPKISGAILRDLPVLLPPYDEQLRIVAKIDFLTTKSRRAKEALDAIPALLERFRKSVLAAAFRGDLTADWREKNPDVEPAEELLKRIRAERRRRWEEAELAKMRAKGKVPEDDRWKDRYEEPESVDASELPELPEGWCWAGLSEVAEIQLGQRRAPEYAGEAEYPYVRAANITWRGLDLSDVQKMGFADPERLFLRPGDVLLNEASGSPTEVGKPAIWRGEIQDCCFQATVLRIRPWSEDLIGDWLHLAFLQDALLGNFAAMAPGVGILHLTAERMRNWPVPLAPSAEQRRLTKVVESLLVGIYKIGDILANLARQVARCDTSILAKAFRGELVPQDPNDEPASVLLERLRVESAENGTTSNGANRRPKAATPELREAVAKATKLAPSPRNRAPRSARR
ncbi:uncharacterized protein SOCE836_102620 [Sorangium cellulosum]|uniref:Type I restriction modification DNA specificity domain-containing protein n=1 Tax=Sorangium cellulosum TaxID=56 RepID=A0A4P2R4K1_SORCE|nr:uncharacterized protein SOCE836_102620 [Sorangium cellulosum]WCQ97312.1 hypothetical protein NQZ70_10103 [Sorangium sp. Soce836]